MTSQLRAINFRLNTNREIRQLRREKIEKEEALFNKNHENLFKTHFSAFQTALDNLFKKKQNEAQVGQIPTSLKESEENLSHDLAEGFDFHLPFHNLKLLPV